MLKITPYKSYNTNFAENKKDQPKYSDPLMNWPARGLAYTNELGAALSEIAPKLGTLLWFPAMLYFGADIYDKYKNEKTSYNPNTQRGTEQAIFQLLASVILPTSAVIGGQKAASMLGVMGKDGLSLQSQEETINFLQSYTGRRHLDKYKNNIADFKEGFEEALTVKREKLVRESKIGNPFNTIASWFMDRHRSHSMAKSQKDKVFNFANKHIDSMFEIYNNLVNDIKPKQFSDKMWNKFIELKTKYAKDPEYKGTYLRDAAEDIIRKYQKSQIRNAKLLKTLGGFVALGIAIKPIDKFVENVIIKKVVAPKLDNVFASNQKVTES